MSDAPVRDEDQEKPLKKLSGVLLALSSVSVAAHAQSTTTPTPATPPAAVTAVTCPVPTPARPDLSKIDWAGLDRYASANAALPAHEAGRVVFFGDSITDAWTRNGGKFFPGKPYVNRGISGQTTEQMLVRFRQDVINLHPDVVVFLAGTNDIAGNTGVRTQEQIAGNIRSMVELAKANHIRVVLASLLPAADYGWRRGLMPAQKIVAFNVWMKQYAAEQGLVYVDYWTPMATPDGALKPELTHDGVHPQAPGYAIMEPLAQAGIDEAMRTQR
ncbi:SGNH/GDSL hydrolase family protein [Granulicella cerasi]|uniref:SGNH/GDSL hydrolase family protein n=1 Tax=Granulicella cerasi TaxID=741063 RepID=A0ABW1Z6X1_9BACT|nr:SGNH/GDSL hydrolase family protein [Granulicella cerasi]